MPVITEGRHSAEFLLSEAEGNRSRDTIKLLAGSGEVKVGTVLGKVTASGKFKPHDPAGNDGSQIPAAINLYPLAVPADADLPASAITRDAEVKGACLTYNAATDTQPEKDAVNIGLAALGIIIR